MSPPNQLDVPPSASWVRANLSPLKNFRHDLPASVVVFLVAVPLCLGIALASGAPLLSGIIAGIVGGIVVSWLSGSAVAVSGPAAGLTVIVLDAIQDLGSWEAFLVAVVLAGAMQLVFGFIKAGIVAYYFPTAVIKGMLAAIGIILILKQIPHAIGFDADYEGDLAFEQLDGRNTFTEIPYALGHIHLGATIIAMVGLVILVVMPRIPRLKNINWLPAPLVAVVMGVVLNEAFEVFAPALANRAELLVSMPGLQDSGLLRALRFPEFARIGDPLVWKVAGTLAIIASIETLLCIEALDKLDPFRRTSDTNRELKAQGIGNLVSGLLGGLPMTAVIVRGSTNVQSGGRTRMASFGHGVLLLSSVALVPGLLARIPLAALAAVLIHVGYKLTPLDQYRRLYGRGLNQFVPFIITIVAIVLTDLLVGVMIGMATGFFLILRANLASPYFMHYRESYAEDSPHGAREHVRIELSENVSFLNKASLQGALRELPDAAIVEIDGSKSLYLDRDVLEIIHDFAESAHHRGIDVRLSEIPSADAPAEQLMARRPMVVRDRRRRPTPPARS